MNAQEIIERIRTAEKQTPVRVFLKENRPVDFPKATVFPCGESKIVFGDWQDIGPVLRDQAQAIDQVVVETQSRNSAIPLLDTRELKARIEPGAIIRDQVEIGDNAVVMMGAIVNIGAVIGAGSMIDMGAVLGGRAMVGKNCHIGAGAVLAGVVEPASAVPVVVEDDVLIGANAVVIEGCRVGQGAVVAAGAVVVEDVPPHTVVAGVPARVLKTKDGKTLEKTALVEGLREL